MVGRIEDEYPHTPKLALANLAFTTQELIFLQSQTPLEVIQALSAAIPSTCLPPGVDVGAIAGTRETESVTDIGLGVAIPHARCPGLPGPLVIFGRSREGVVYKGGSGEPVKLFFLLVTPLEQAEAQVVLLSQLALFAGNADTRQALLQARSAEEVLTIFHEFNPQS